MDDGEPAAAASDLFWKDLGVDRVDSFEMVGGVLGAIDDRLLQPLPSRVILRVWLMVRSPGLRKGEDARHLRGDTLRLEGDQSDVPELSLRRVDSIEPTP